MYNGDQYFAGLVHVGCASHGKALRESLNSVRSWRPGAFATAYARPINPIIGNHATVVDSASVVVHANFRLPAGLLLPIAGPAALAISWFADGPTAAAPRAVHHGREMYRRWGHLLLGSPWGWGPTGLGFGFFHVPWRLLLGTPRGRCPTGFGLGLVHVPWVNQPTAVGQDRI